MRTVARREGEWYVLSGAKTFITTGDLADVIVLFATVDREAGRRGITAFLLDRDAPGLSAGRVLGKLGLRGSSTAELFLDECRIPGDNRLGEEGAGYGLSIRSVVKSRMSAAAQGVGFARAAYTAAARWAASRDLLSSGRRDAQAVQFTLAELRTEVAAARTLLYATAGLVDRAEGDPVAEVAMCKLRCTDTGVAVALAAMDLLGEDGDLVSVGVERVLRDARATQIYDGTNQVQRLLIARDLRGRLEGS
jgi:alkylation response protein AidB-like acyl-CoA dehydrogenase